MTKTTRNLLFAFISFFLVGLLVVLLFSQNHGTLLNFIAGYANAMLVLGASSLGYWQLVQGSEEKVPDHDFPDTYERVDDRFGLWEEELSSLGSDDVAEILREEKRGLKKGRKGLKVWFANTRPALSIYRLAAYAILVGTVLWLIRSGVFDPFFYLLGTGMAPGAMVMALWLSR